MSEEEELDPILNFSLPIFNEEGHAINEGGQVVEPNLHYLALSISNKNSQTVQAASSNQYIWGVRKSLVKL